MGRRLTILVPLIALICVAALGTAGPGEANPTSPPTLAANEAAANIDAARLLSEVITPPGAVRLTVEPAGDNGYLKPAAHLVVTTIGTVDTAWFQTAGETPGQVIAGAALSPPPGVTETGPFTVGNPGTGLSARGVTFFIAPVPGVLASRIVEVTATTLSGGDTGILVQSESVWVVPRTAASLIPSGTRMISISETRAGRVLRSTTITAGARVRAGVAFFNGLGAAQPGVTNCGLQAVEHDSLTVTFLARGGTAPLATASFSGNFGQSGSGVSTTCNAVSLRVGTTAQDPLLGGGYVAALNRLFGTRIPL